VDLVTPVSSAVWESVHKVIVATYIKTRWVLGWASKIYQFFYSWGIQIGRDSYMEW
jgi:hypothetical protein